MPARSPTAAPTAAAAGIKPDGTNVWVNEYLDRINRPPQAKVVPSTTPDSESKIDSPKIRRTISARDQPTARRIPNSRVRSMEVPCKPFATSR